MLKEIWKNILYSVKKWYTKKYQILFFSFTSLHSMNHFWVTWWCLKFIAPIVINISITYSMICFIHQVLFNSNKKNVEKESWNHLFTKKRQLDNNGEVEMLHFYGIEYDFYGSHIKWIWCLISLREYISSVPISCSCIIKKKESWI